VSTTRRLDVRVSKVVDRVVVKVNLEQLDDPLSSKPLLMTHEHNPDSDPVSVDIHSGIENSDPVGGVARPAGHQVHQALLVVKEGQNGLSSCSCPKLGELKHPVLTQLGTSVYVGIIEALLQ
jgi:hypothetical protein